MINPVEEVVLLRGSIGPACGSIDIPDPDRRAVGCFPAGQAVDIVIAANLPAHTACAAARWSGSILPRSFSLQPRTSHTPA